MLIADPEEALGSLTDKRVELLDPPVRQHARQIARPLDIALDTIDLRISAVREKRRARDRDETARPYASLLQRCGKSPSGFPSVAPRASSEASPRLDLQQTGAFAFADAQPTPHWNGASRMPRSLTILDARFGKSGPTAAIVLLGTGVAAALAMARALGRYF